jgi:hypothetical protein
VEQADQGVEEVAGQFGTRRQLRAERETPNFEILTYTLNWSAHNWSVILLLCTLIGRPHISLSCLYARKV